MYLRNLVWMAVLSIYSFMSFNTTYAQSTNYVSVIVDLSKSINDPLNGVNKIDIIKNNLVNGLEKIDSLNLNLTVFGHKFDASATNKQASCESYEVLHKFNEPFISLVSQISTLEAKGWTPLGITFANAIGELINFGGNKSLIMIIDGEDNCGLDPLAVLESFNDEDIKRINFELISLDVDDNTQAFISDLGKNVNLTQYKVTNEQEFVSAMLAISTKINNQGKIKNLEFNSNPEEAKAFDFTVLNKIFKIDNTTDSELYTFFNLATNDILEINVKNSAASDNILTKISILDESLKELENDTVLGKSKESKSELLITTPGKYFLKITSNNTDYLNDTYFSISIKKSQTGLIPNDSEVPSLTLMGNIIDLDKQYPLLKYIAMLVFAVTLISWFIYLLVSKRNKSEYEFSPELQKVNRETPTPYFETTTKTAVVDSNTIDPIQSPSVVFSNIKQGPYTPHINKNQLEELEVSEMPKIDPKNEIPVIEEIKLTDKKIETNTTLEKIDEIIQQPINPKPAKKEKKLFDPKKYEPDTVAKQKQTNSKLSEIKEKEPEVKEDKAVEIINNLLDGKSTTQAVSSVATAPKLEPHKKFIPIESDVKEKQKNKTNQFAINIENADSPSVPSIDTKSSYNLPKGNVKNEDQLKIRGRRNAFLYRDNFNSFDIKSDTKPNLNNNHVKQNFIKLGIPEPLKSELSETTNNLSLNGNVKYSLVFHAKQDFDDIYQFYKELLQREKWVFVGAHDLSTYQKSMIFRKDKYDLDILIENTYFKIASNTVKLYLTVPSKI